MRATSVAAMAPITICPSMPMFHRPAAKVTTSPAEASTSGTQAMSVEDEAPPAAQSALEDELQGLVRRGVHREQQQGPDGQRRGQRQQGRQEAPGPGSRVTASPSRR